MYNDDCFNDLPLGVLPVGGLPSKVVFTLLPVPTVCTVYLLFLASVHRGIHLDIILKLFYC